MRRWDALGIDPAHTSTLTTSPDRWIVVITFVVDVRRAADCGRSFKERRTSAQSDSGPPIILPTTGARLGDNYGICWPDESVASNWRMTAIQRDAAMQFP